MTFVDMRTIFGTWYARTHMKTTNANLNVIVTFIGNKNTNSWQNKFLIKYLYLFFFNNNR